MTDVSANLKAIEQRIAAACHRANRARDSVQLLAVSKLHPAACIRAAYQSGQRDFGENYAQELRDKAGQLADLADIRWHAIGPLQLNKAKYIAKLAYAFHALDRTELAEELSKRRAGPALRCYLELNLGGESTKSGVPISELDATLPRISALPHLEIVGLMCLPPLGMDPEASRPFFRSLREAAQRHGLSELSMGTTHDFEVAIEEEATIIRVGSAIFGERPG
jgi:pyridoxal phosphate enzyme (YggS family)